MDSGATRVTPSIITRSSATSARTPVAWRKQGVVGVTGHRAGWTNSLPSPRPPSSFRGISHWCCKRDTQCPWVPTYSSSSSSSSYFPFPFAWPLLLLVLSLFLVTFRLTLPTGCGVPLQPATSKYKIKVMLCIVTLENFYDDHPRLNHPSGLLYQKLGLPPVFILQRPNNNTVFFFEWTMTIITDSKTWEGKNDQSAFGTNESLQLTLNNSGIATCLTEYTRICSNEGAIIKLMIFNCNRQRGGGADSIKK